MSDKIPIKRALLSVSDKAGIVDLAQHLHALNIELLSTGGTATLLRQQQIPVTEISDYTGFPEIMDGRVKTLHPKIYGGLLGRRGIDDATMKQHGFHAIDLVIVNLYSFEKTIQNPNCDLATAIENIDIGGPTMLRAAAKNFVNVAVVSDPDEYPAFIAELTEHHGATRLETRFKLAQKTFAHVAHYDALISNYLNALRKDEKLAFPDFYTVQYQKKQDLRYGENPHQQAAFYTELNQRPGTLAAAQQIQGKELSFNNIADSDAAWECVKTFSDNACVIVKHANPCGVATADDQITAYQKAFTTDPTSAFGGIIAFNRPLSAETAKTILEQQFVEVIIAPDIEANAITVLQQKPNVRVLSCGVETSSAKTHLDYKRVSGGLLIQDTDIGNINPADLKIVTQRKPSEAEIKELLFAWKVAKFVKSNAIVLTKNNATVGIGAGQMSRVDSMQIALNKAKNANLNVAGTVMASDAFFPFRDSIDFAAKAGITAIIQPGGSMRDAEIIQAANEANIAMVFTGMRHFLH